MEELRRALDTTKVKLTIDSLQRWKILQDTQSKIFQIQQDVTKEQEKKAEEIYRKWDEYIRDS